ncbi:DofB protein [Stigmatella sp. ncwal1]|uniref:DofB protein n=1 Tax=Stigmatella ashevillensis TaxID=2995309 RepID=A0ABT5DE22_9BACT|nr:DofB protein [Stigmatella ashevillena]MDC0711927.1 DofB protein [Stigmatella ashevillena]
MTTAYKSDVIDRIFFARYPQPPSKDTVAAVVSLVAAAQQRIGQPLIYVGSIDSKSKVPNAEERNNLNTLLAELRPYCEAINLIIEGSELQNSLQRVVISGMIIFTRTYDNFAVHKSIDGVTADLAERLKKDVSPLIKLARDRGLVS